TRPARCGRTSSGHGSGVEPQATASVCFAHFACGTPSTPRAYRPDVSRRRPTMQRSIPSWTCLLVALISPAGARATVTAFPMDLTGFNAAAGNPPVVVDFDGITSGTDIGGQTIDGVTFSPSVTGAPLRVV